MYRSGFGKNTALNSTVPKIRLSFLVRMPPPNAGKIFVLELSPFILNAVALPKIKGANLKYKMDHGEKKTVSAFRFALMLPPIELYLKSGRP